MKKILLVGELNEIARSMNECLAEEYQVQLCSPQLESMQGMIKIIKPDLVLVCQIGLDEMDGTLFDWLRQNCPKLPVLIITSSSWWNQCKAYCESEQFDKMFRPIVNRELLQRCQTILNGKIGKSLHSASGDRKKILIVDDSPLVLRNIKGLLEDRYDIELAVSGEQALKRIPAKQPDLVLLDYEMPGMSGKGTFEAMLEDEYAREIPVIFLTSVAKRKRIYDVLKSSPAGYILKPPVKETLLSTIEKVLRGETDSVIS